MFYKNKSIYLQYVIFNCVHITLARAREKRKKERKKERKICKFSESLPSGEFGARLDAPSRAPRIRRRGLGSGSEYSEPSTPNAPIYKMRLTAQPKKKKIYHDIQILHKLHLGSASCMCRNEEIYPFSPQKWP